MVDYFCMCFRASFTGDIYIFFSVKSVYPTEWPRFASVMCPSGPVFMLTSRTSYIKLNSQPGYSTGLGF